MGFGVIISVIYEGVERGFLTSSSIVCIGETDVWKTLEKTSGEDDLGFLCFDFVILSIESECCFWILCSSKDFSDDERSTPNENKTRFLEIF